MITGEFVLKSLPVVATFRHDFAVFWLLSWLVGQICCGHFHAQHLTEVGKHIPKCFPRSERAVSTTIPSQLTRRSWSQNHGNGGVKPAMKTSDTDYVNQPNSAIARWESPDEFARRTGLSIATVRRRLADGSIPSIQPGGHRTRVLIPVSALQAPPIGQPPSASSPGADTDDSSVPERPRPRRGPRPRWATK